MACRNLYSTDIAGPEPPASRSVTITSEKHTVAEPAGNRPGEITVLIHEAQQGNRESEGKLMSRVYNELTRIAAAQLRLERPNHSFHLATSSTRPSSSLGA